MKKNILIMIFLIILIAFLLFYDSTLFIKLNGEKTNIIDFNSNYTEMGATNLFGKELKAIGNVNTSKIGEYQVKYCHLNNCINRNVSVIDNEKPVILLNGTYNINIALDKEYVEAGFSATDNYDGDLTKEVKINSNLDNNKVGSYEIEYEVSDSSGNTSTAIRKINVNENGPMSMSIKDFNLDGYFTNTILKETTSDDNYLNETIFYGDSITENFAYYQNISYDNIWAKSNLTPVNAHTWNVMFYKYNKQINIIEGFKEYHPKRVIITMGANAIAIMDRNYFISQYEDLVIKLKEASPDTQIIIQSVTPVDDRWDNKANSLSNNKINNTNYLLAEMCERQNIKFLNTAEVLKNENGSALKGYFYDNDGIHPLPIANEIIMNYVKTHRWE